MQVTTQRLERKLNENMELWSQRSKIVEEEVKEEEENLKDLKKAEEKEEKEEEQVKELQFKA